ncbi:hypothetical protein FRC07_003917 [Ceratobasidium sp. 392]|nr:hypothetical protein FRC07_003917 [Ceratobasidium sp. 392]
MPEFKLITLRPRYPDFTDLHYLTMAEDFRSKDWYTGSLSETLSNLSHKIKPIAPENTYTILFETATRVFCLELRFHEQVKRLDKGTLIDPDPAYIMNSYAHALVDLRMRLENPNPQDEGDPCIEDLRKELIPLLELKHAMWQVRTWQLHDEVERH